MWLHEPNNLSETPCVGRCTTSVIPFDDVCKGCGRTVAEIRDWGRYTELEKISLQANHQILFNLSQKYDGKSYYKSQYSELKNEILALESKNLSFQEESQSDLINLKWIFILLFVFLSLEWFLRKRITNI